MRLVSFLKDGRWWPAFQRGDQIVEIDGSDGASPQDLLRSVLLGEPFREGATHKADDVTLGLPIPHPGKIVCLGLNYVDHAKEGGNPIPDYPAFFIRVQSSLVAPGAPVLRPRVSEKLDYECELTIVIGRTAHDVAEADALDYVFGYTLMNDVSVRDYQRKSTQWTAGKNFDATGPLGPVIATADALPPGAHGLGIRTRLNGKVMQESDTSDMIFSVARTVSLLSEVMTLEPGDVIATGTPPGVGLGQKPPSYLKAGDTVTLSIEGLGVQRQKFVQG